MINQTATYFENIAKGLGIAGSALLVLPKTVSCDEKIYCN